jgi:hypothetical protein
MKRALSFRQFTCRLVLAVFGCAMLAMTAGWQFVPGPQAQQPQRQRPHPTLQQQIDALPRLDGTGMTNGSEGGLIQLATPGEARQRVIRIDRPLRLPSCVGIDGGGAKIIYSGPPDRAAIELASTRADGYYYAPQNMPTIANLHIVSSGKAIGFDVSVTGNSEYLTIENVSISAAGDAIDLRPPGTGGVFGTRLVNVNVYRPGAAALYLRGNTVTIDGLRVCYGPRDPFAPPPAYVNVCGLTGGGGTIKDLHVESYNADRRESVTALAVTGGTWTMIQGHLEQPGPAPAVTVSGRDTSLTLLNQGIYQPVPVLATGGARLMILSPNPFPDERLLHDAQSSITLNAAKRGTVVKVTK